MYTLHWPDKSMRTVAVYSEQAQEHWNKYRTKYNYKSGGLPEPDSMVNIIDRFQRILGMTHPQIAHKRRKIVQHNLLESRVSESQWESQSVIKFC